MPALDPMASGGFIGRPPRQPGRWVYVGRNTDNGAGLGSNRRISGRTGIRTTQVPRPDRCPWPVPFRSIAQRSMFHMPPTPDLTDPTVASVSTDPEIRGRSRSRWLHRVRSPAGSVGLGMLAVLALLLVLRVGLCVALGAWRAGWSPALLRLMLLHQYSCLRAQLKLDGWQQAPSFEDLAERLWGG